MDMDYGPVKLEPPKGARKGEKCKNKRQCG